MKQKLHWIIVLGACLLVAQANAGKAPVLKSDKDRISYGIGVNMGKNFKTDAVDIDLTLLNRGLKDGLADAKLLMPEKELHQLMREFQSTLRQKAVQRQRIAVEENRRKGIKFLEENKAKADVVTLPSGLQYKIIKAGNGAKPTDADTVLCYYRGTLLDGTEFDGTEPGKPATLKVASLIPGWKEALKLMPAGSKWQLAVPSELAYGSRGVGESVGPNETLLFDLELIQVMSPLPAPQALPKPEPSH
jgi:FKBP-type peptidyl-prolyl cis-trans isomerase FklB